MKPLAKYLLIVVLLSSRISYGDRYSVEMERNKARVAEYSRFAKKQYRDRYDWYKYHHFQYRSHSKQYYLNRAEYKRNQYEKRKGDNRRVVWKNGRAVFEY